MKKILLVMAAAMLAASCAKEPRTDATGLKPTFAVDVDSYGSQTRVAVNYGADDYFTGWSTDLADIEITLGANTETYTYDNATGFLTAANDGLEFPANGEAVAVTAKWPSEAMRRNPTDAARKDQSTKEVFMGEDWLVSAMTDVAPTKIVPLSFVHERTKIAFAAKGAGLTTTKISALTLGGFKAYCGDASSDNAQLMLDPAADADVLVAGATGTMTVDGTNYNFTLGKVPAVLVAGGYHEITLTVE